MCTPVCRRPLYTKERNRLTKNVCSAVIYKEIPIYWCNLYNFGFPLDSQKQKHYNNPYCTSAPHFVLWRGAVPISVKETGDLGKRNCHDLCRLALEDELEQLKTVKRKEVAEKIKVARGYGDLSENSEYDEAKNEQGLVEGRIALLEKMLKHARVVTEDELSTDHISVGSHVRIKDEDGDEDEYDITGSTEADPVNGKISDESPIGAALIGHSVGDKVDITLPSGAVVQYEVMEIGRAEL